MVDVAVGAADRTAKEARRADGRETAAAGRAVSADDCIFLLLGTVGGRADGRGKQKTYILGGRDYDGQHGGGFGGEHVGVRGERAAAGET